MNNKNIMHRYIVTTPAGFDNDLEALLHSSPEESKAKDYMYGNSDMSGPAHMKLWDMRQGDDDQPKLIDEINRD